MRIDSKFITMAIFYLLSSCGSGGGGGSDSSADEFEATYEVVTHKENETGCEPPTENRAEGDKFFKLKIDLLGLGDNSLYYSACTSASECEELTIGADWYFPERVEGVWQGDAGSIAAGSEGSSKCFLSVREVLAELEGNVISMQAQTYSGNVELTEGEDCLDDKDALLVKYRKSLTCSSSESITANKL